MRKLILACLVLIASQGYTEDWRILLNNLETERLHTISLLRSAELSFQKVSNELENIRQEYENLQQLSRKQAALYENRIRVLNDLAGQLQKDITEREQGLRQLEMQLAKLKSSEKLVGELEKSLNALKEKNKNDKIVLQITLGITSAGLAASGAGFFVKGEPLMAIIALALAAGGGVIILCVD